MTSAPEIAVARVEAALATLTGNLLGCLNAQGHWSGELSTSALSTAVAVIALNEIDRRSGLRRHQACISPGLKWLAQNANRDGGWGDTVRSKSNLSTTALCWAAFGARGADREFQGTVTSAEAWLVAAAGSLDRLPTAIADRYGKDRTFSVPILMTLAISGRLDAEGWREIPALPFELAVLPRRFFGALRLPVVSYALPALIAIGQALHRHAPSRNPILRSLRNWSCPRTLRRLVTLQPDNGGFLEATPLTAFVTMSLASFGAHEHTVAQKGAAFLRSSMRADGSWPIDTNLVTWVTTLSIKALSAQPDVLRPHAARLRSWLLNQQTKEIHPYTGAAPGAWAWTDLPGGVPDADDTAGALTALWELGPPDGATLQAAEAGLRWLLNVANRDGGIPTFCPGWGALPFDRSSPDITAHTIRAWVRWRDRVAPALQSRTGRVVSRALHFLQSTQRPDGSWVPLWFGNENSEEECNPVYGTAQVLIALNDLADSGWTAPEPARTRAAAYLASAQGKDGGWGGDKHAPPSTEETAVALQALCGVAGHEDCVSRGVEWLLSMTEQGLPLSSAPLGLYFARLWYFERLYPLIFSIGALSAVRAKFPLVAVDARRL